MIETSIIFDPAILYNLYFRINRDGVPQTIIFSGLINVNTKTWQLNIFASESAVDVFSPVLQLLSGSGLTLATDRITISPTQAQTATMMAGEYYWQLYNVTDKQTWINGRAYFHRGEFDNFASSGANTITITVSGILEAPQDGQQYARQNAGWSVVSGGGGGFWSLNNGGALTGNNTISGAFNLGFTNNAVGFGVAPGSITPDTRVEIRGAGITAATNALRVANNDNVELLKVNNSGQINIGVPNSSNPNARLQIRGATTQTGLQPIIKLEDSNGNSVFDIRDDGTFEVQGSNINTAMSVQDVTGIGSKIQSLVSGFGGTAVGSWTNHPLGFLVNNSVVGGFSTNGGFIVGALPQFITASAILDVQSTTRAVVLPRMTTAQRDAIPNPSAGMLIFNIATGVFNFHNGTVWGPI